MEFNVVVDTFPNPTTMAVADLILPAATIAEKESFRSWWSPLQVMMPAVQVGECRSDWEINLELAKRFNPELARRYDTVKDLINDRLKPSGFTFDELKDGHWKFPEKDTPTRPYRRYEKGCCARTASRASAPRPASWSSTRPASKSSEHGSAALLHRASGERGPHSRACKKYPLVMVTGRRSPVFFHSEHRKIPWLRECDPDPIVEIHPQTAKEVGIDDGEWVADRKRPGPDQAQGQGHPHRPSPGGERAPRLVAAGDRGQGAQPLRHLGPQLQHPRGHRPRGRLRLRGRSLQDPAGGRDKIYEGEE